MKKKKSFLAIIFVLLFLLPVLGGENEEGFKFRRLTPKICVLTDRENGGSQLGIVSEKGIVILDSFSSASTAKRFRTEWKKFLNRSDFIYMLNTVDRLDIFGGNSAYSDITIIGHQVFKEKFTRSAVNAEIARLIKMWRWKEDVSRKRQPTHKKGSEKYKIEVNWTKFCKRRAEELEAGFELVLPDISFRDRITLDLGDLTVHMTALGKAGYDGLSIISVPGEKTAIISGFILHSHHLAPHPQRRYAELDVERWIRILEDLTAETNPIEKYICGTTSIWTRERVQKHLQYIKTLWNRVQDLEREGKNLEQIQEQLSMEKEFASVKKMKVYLEHGDDWVRPQHKDHVWNFFVQHKKLASHLLKKELVKLDAEKAVKKIRLLAKEDKSVYFDESTTNSLGYFLLNSGRIDDALVIFKLNANLFPGSANCWDSLGEAWVKKGNAARAKECYEQVLKIDPQNKNASAVLEKLKRSR